MNSKIKRVFTMFTAVMTMAIILCCTTVTASAAEVKPVTASNTSYTATVSAPSVAAIPSIIPNVPNLILGQNQTPQTPAQQTPGASGGMTHNNADSAYTNVVNFIVKWLKRAGLLIAFFGAGMLLLAVKNEDADGKQRGALTLIAGFGLAALCQGVDMFNLLE